MSPPHLICQLTSRWLFIRGIIAQVETDRV